MEDTNGPVFMTGYAPAPRHSYATNDGTAIHDARRFIRPSRNARRRLLVLPFAWYAAGLVSGAGLAVVVAAGTAALKGCGW